jgi:hypothetical protein
MAVCWWDKLLLIATPVDPLVGARLAANRPSPDIKAFVSGSAK